MSDTKSVRVRFAPSPTGFLHIGGARTCMFNWLYARKHNGTFILRIEDTDLTRSKKEYLDEILESIRWLGMNWDELYYQSQRFDLYRSYAKKLLEEGKAYHKEGAIFFKYDFDEVVLQDLIRGKIVFRELPKQEEVILKSDGSPTYNFSCVIDDATMNISCVIRGEDHISNTPKQLLMYKALGFSVPEFAHVPLILSPDGGRLSKRFGATSIREYRQMGYTAAALANYLLLLGWSPGQDRELIGLSEAETLFAIEDVNATGAVFSLDKLKWLNGTYIRALDLKAFSKIACDYLRSQEAVADNVSNERISTVVALFQERISALEDLIECTHPFFYDTIEYSDEGREVLAKPFIREIQFLVQQLKATDNFNKEELEHVFRDTAERCNVKAKILIHPVRVALTGVRHGAGLFEIMEVLGKATVLKRVEALIAYWGGKQ